MNYFLLAVLIFIFLALVIYDLKTQKMPIWLLVFAIAAGLGYGARNNFPSGFLGAAFIFCFFGLFYVFSKGKLIGTGDLLLGVALGFFIGWPNSVWMLVLAATLGLIAAVIKKRHKIPFGPFLILSSLILLFFPI